MVTLQLLGWYINPVQTPMYTHRTNSCIIAIIKSSTLHIPVQLPSDSCLCRGQQYASQARLLRYCVLYRGELVDLQWYIILIYYVRFAITTLLSLSLHCVPNSITAIVNNYIIVMEAYVHNFNLAS